MKIKAYRRCCVHLSMKIRLRNASYAALHGNVVAANKCFSLGEYFFMWFVLFFVSFSRFVIFFASLFVLIAYNCLEVFIFSPMYLSSIIRISILFFSLWLFASALFVFFIQFRCFFLLCLADFSLFLYFYCFCIVFHSDFTCFLSSKFISGKKKWKYSPSIKCIVHTYKMSDVVMLRFARLLLYCMMIRFISFLYCLDLF